MLQRTPSIRLLMALTVRDMVGAVAVLVVIVLVFAGATRSCSFAPGGPSVDPGAGPTVDAPAQLRVLAGAMPCPLRVPALPPDWRAKPKIWVRARPVPLPTGLVGEKGPNTPSRISGGGPAPRSETVMRT